MAKMGRPKKADKRRGRADGAIPKVRALEAIAAGEGYDPGTLTMMLFGDNQRRLMTWYEYLKAGTMPPDMPAGSHMRDAWARFYTEAADFMRTEERYLEFFHGKRQRVEATIDADVTEHIVSEEPISDDEWEDRYRLEAPEGPAEGTH